MEIPKDDAKNRIFLAALNLFMSKGYSATSVSMIAEKAKVTKPMLYYYFKNKEGLYAEIMHRASADYEALIVKHSDTEISVRGAILSMFTEMMELQESNLEYVRLIYAMVYGPPQGVPQINFGESHNKMISMIEDIVKKGIRDGELVLDDSKDFTITILSILHYCMGTGVLTYLDKMTSEDMRRMVNKIFDKYSE